MKVKVKYYFIWGKIVLGHWAIISFVKNSSYTSFFFYQQAVWTLLIYVLPVNLIRTECIIILLSQLTKDLL